MNRQALLGTLSAVVVLLASVSPSVAAQGASDGSFVLANMAPPEPEPPAAPEATPAASPEAAPTAAPEAPAAPEGEPAPAEAPPVAEAPAAPEAPAEPLPPPDQTAPSAGLSSGMMITIVAAIAAALGAGYWMTQRKQ